MARFVLFRIGEEGLLGLGRRGRLWCVKESFGGARSGMAGKASSDEVWKPWRGRYGTAGKLG